jgi:hypothetical protein
MKPKHWLLSVGAGGALLAASVLPSRSIDTAPLQQQFQAAEPRVQAQAERAALAIHSADYPRALGELKRLVFNRKITPRQRRTLRNLVSRLERTAGSSGGAESINIPSQSKAGIHADRDTSSKAFAER